MCAQARDGRRSVRVDSLLDRCVQAENRQERGRRCYGSRSHTVKMVVKVCLIVTKTIKSDSVSAEHHGSKDSLWPHIGSCI